MNGDARRGAPERSFSVLTFLVKLEIDTRLRLSLVFQKGVDFICSTNVSLTEYVDKIFLLEFITTKLFKYFQLSKQTMNPLRNLLKFLF